MEKHIYDGQLKYFEEYLAMEIGNLSNLLIIASVNERWGMIVAHLVQVEILLQYIVTSMGGEIHTN